MDRANIEKRLSWLNPSQLRRAQGRRLKIYVPQLDLNFRLVNPSGRALSMGMKIALAQKGIILGWKVGATVWPSDISYFELGLKRMLAVRFDQGN